MPHVLEVETRLKMQHLVQPVPAQRGCSPALDYSSGRSITQPAL